MPTVWLPNIPGVMWHIFNYILDLGRLNLWEPLHALLSSESSTSEIKTQALWVIGTALQNNPSAQDVVGYTNVFFFS